MKNILSYFKNEIGKEFKLYDLDGNVTCVVRILDNTIKVTLNLLLSKEIQIHHK